MLYIYFMYRKVFKYLLKVLRREHFQINGSNLFCFLLNDWISSQLSALLLPHRRWILAKYRRGILDEQMFVSQR